MNICKIDDEDSNIQLGRKTNTKRHIERILETASQVVLLKSLSLICGLLFPQIGLERKRSLRYVLLLLSLLLLLLVILSLSNGKTQ